MANKAIKGITVEIGGDTTKLGEAISDSEKKSRSLQNELKDIEKLLKFDPTNVELLSQKQNVLTKSISATNSKLSTLKEAERQVIEQFERGEVAESQVRALQREIIQCERSLSNMETELSSTETALRNVGNQVDTVEQSTQDYATSINDASQELSDFKDKAKSAFDTLKTGATVIGGATVAAGGYALNVSTEFDKAFNTLKTKTGASADEMDTLNESMENIYANNFGESIEDVAESMATIKNQTKLTGKELEGATKDAILLRDTFGYDVSESTRAANALMTQFGVDSKTAYNLIAQGAQNGLDQNGDLLDVINEYSVHFKQLGIDAPSMFTMLSSGAESGTFSIDKLGDAVKEFGIRARDGSKSTREAFDYLGYDADEMFKTFNEGGKDAGEWARFLMDEIAYMPDSVEKTTLGVALFGTMWEDLGAKAIGALDGFDTELDYTKDVLTDINKQKYDDIGSSIQGLGRILQTDLAEPIGEELKPYVEEVIDYVQDNGPEIKEVMANVVESVGKFVGYVVENGETILSVIAGIGAGLLVWNVANMIISVVASIKSFVAMIKSGTTVMKAFNIVTGMNPMVLLAAAITAVIVAVVAFVATNEDAQKKLAEIWESIKKTVGNAIDAIIHFFTVTVPEKWNDFLKFCRKFIDNIVGYFLKLPGKIGNSITKIITKITNWRKKMHDNMVIGIKKIIDATLKFFTELPGKIAYAIGFTIGKLVKWSLDVKEWAKEEVPKIIDSILDYFKKLPGKIGTCLMRALKKLEKWAGDMKNKAVSGVKSLSDNVVKFFSELPEKIEKSIFKAISNIENWGKKMKEKATSSAKGMVDSVETTAKDMPGKIADGISGAVKKIETWGRDMKNKASAAIKDAASSVEDGVKGLPDTMENIGKNIVEGLWNGFKNTKKWLEDKIKGFADSILDGMKDALGIESPSKVFRDEVGRYVAEGIGVGIEENEDTPLMALNSLGEDMAAQEFALNGATINRKLNTTFSVGQVSSGVYNESLLGKLDRIYERINHLQIVLNNKVLVGEVLDDIDAALANKQLLAARGM